MFHEQDHDLVVEAMPSNKPSQSAKFSASSSTSSSAVNDGVQPRNAGKRSLLMQLRLEKETKNFRPFFYLLFLIKELFPSLNSTKIFV